MLESSFARTLLTTNDWRPKNRTYPDSIGMRRNYS